MSDSKDEKLKGQMYIFEDGEYKRIKGAYIWDGEKYVEVVVSATDNQGRLTEYKD